MQDKFLLQETSGRFDIKFWGIPIKFLKALIYISKVDLYGDQSVARIYSLHITPFFALCFCVPIELPHLALLEVKSKDQLQNV